MEKIKKKLQPYYSFEPFIKDGEIVAFNVDNDNEILAVIAHKALDYQHENSYGSFAKTKPDEQQVYEILKSSNGELSSLCLIKEEKFNIHDVQLLPQNRVLLICARSEYRSANDFDKNGRIYSDEGVFLDEILLGDGIQDTQVTREGEIWTSYFDEGVFGNKGWDQPIGSSGLIAWNYRGDKLYEFSPALELDHICDCYALNVLNKDEAWCYYYTDFPLVKIRKGKIENYWETSVAGSNAFAINGDCALFSGGYDSKGTLDLVQLKENHKVSTLRKFNILDENGSEFRNVEIVGRADKLYFLNNEKVYAFSISQALEK